MDEKSTAVKKLSGEKCVHGEPVEYNCLACGLSGESGADPETMPVLRDALRRAAHFDPLVKALSGLVKEHDERYDEDLKMPDTSPMVEARDILQSAEEAVA